MEEPFAVEASDVTLSLTGLVDGRLIRETEGTDGNDTSLIANFQVSAATQLANRWRVDLSYFGQHASDPATVFGTGDGYTDNAALTVGGHWGTLLAGNVSGLIRAQTRRLRGVGNASLAFDDALGTREDDSAGYRGRFGPWVVGAVFDRDDNSNLGAVFQRPSGTLDRRVALRILEGDHAAADMTEQYDTTTIGVASEVTYACTTLDAGVGLERLSSERPDVRRRLSLGRHSQQAGHADDFAQGALGRSRGRRRSFRGTRQCDLARGLSANLGVNHARAMAAIDNVQFVDIDTTTTAVSLR